MSTIRVGVVLASLVFAGTIGCSSEPKKEPVKASGCACSDKSSAACPCPHCSGADKSAACVCKK